MDVAASVALIAALFVLRQLAIRFIRGKTDAAPHLQRRWTASIKNLFLALVVIGLILIWAPQLQTFALSLTAVAVAIVVATKELILCFSGAFMRASSRAFSVGDWIEVAGTRGEVVDHNIFVTVLQEFESGSYRHSGRSVIVANSAFFGSPIRNHSFLRDHTYHTFSVVIEPTLNIFRERPLIEQIVNAHYAPFAEKAAQVNAQIEHRTEVDLFDPQVHVGLSTTELGKYRITITLFSPTAQAEALEQKIVIDLMARLHDMTKNKQEHAGQEDASPPSPAP